MGCISQPTDIVDAADLVVDVHERYETSFTFDIPEFDRKHVRLDGTICANGHVPNLASAG